MTTSSRFETFAAPNAKVRNRRLCDFAQAEKNGPLLPRRKSGCEFGAATGRVSAGL